MGYNVRGVLTKNIIRRQPLTTKGQHKQQKDNKNNIVFLRYRIKQVVFVVLLLFIVVQRLLIYCLYYIVAAIN